MRKDKHQPEPVAPTDTAKTLQETVQAAKSLASIPDQELLDNPALNPHTRSRYDELTAARLQEELTLAHTRKLRAAQEVDRREGEQAATDQAIAAARQATNPAKTVIDMTRHQRTFGRIVLTASLLLSVGSALGMEALVQNVNGPTGVGYLAEVGLTGLSTTVIIWAGILARSGTTIEKTTARLFAVLIGGPLLVSIAGSTFGSGPVGAACSIGSALFAALAYLITTTSSDAIGQALVKIDRIERARTTPSATPGGVLPRRSASRAQESAPQGGVGEDAAAWLAQVTEDNARREASQEADEAGRAEESAPRAEEPPTLPELELFPDLEGPRWEVMLYIHAHGRGVPTRQIVRATRLPRSTVRDHRTALWHDGYEAFDPNKVNDS